MKKIMFILLALAFLALPFVSADLITPGFHSIPVVNNITNFNEFSDYYFLTICTNPMSSASVIENGIIGNCYKYSQLDIYAVKKSDLNIIDLEKINKMSDADFSILFNQTKFKLVISNIEHYVTVPDASPTQSIYNAYAIDINKLKTQPDNKQIERSNIVYYYIGIPLIVLVILVIILIRRQRKNASA